MYFAALVIALIIMGYYMLLTDRENLWFVLLVAFPFILFYLFSPLFVRLRPKKKFQDSLYDTDMVNTPNTDPDPTMAATAKVTPAFVDDIVLGDDDYKPAINSDIFNAIKEERKVVADTDGGTRAFDKFENISSSGQDIGETRVVGNIRNISDDSADSL